MANYLLCYVGDPGMPESEEEGAKVMQAWMGWLSGLGDSVFDAGNPIMAAKTVLSNGSVTDGVPRLGGYSIVKADGLNDAVAKTAGCPHLGAGGDIEVFETIDMGA